MPLNLASPGILVREVDLTVGRVDPTSERMGAIVAPFAQGPVELPTIVENEQELLSVFGKPYGNDNHYEHWLVASSFLAYGGSLTVVRASDSGLANAGVGTSGTGGNTVAIGTSALVKNIEQFEELGYDDNGISGVSILAKDPGSWGNGLRIGIIDAFADQTLTNVTNANVIPVGAGVTQSVSDRTNVGSGSTIPLDGYLKGIVTGTGTSEVYVKVVSHVSSAGTVTEVDYQEGGVWEFKSDENVAIATTLGSAPSGAGVTTYGHKDWYDSQVLTLGSGKTVNWSEVAPKPGTSEYATERGGRFDEVHVVVIDGDGAITGNAGTILEKNLSISKSSDATFSSGSPASFRKYLASNSAYIFGSHAPATAVAADFVADDLQSNSWTGNGEVSWNRLAENNHFGVIGNYGGSLQSGKNYNAKEKITETDALDCGLDDIVSGYGLFENAENLEIDFLLMGSAAYPKLDAAALANKLIAVAEARKDAIAFISPYRAAALTGNTGTNQDQIRKDSDITDNVVSFYGPVTSSSYAVFDTGYKYMYDRFANTFRYVPLNGDIAGTCARNDINNFPWFSPAGTVRGTILNAVKLAYNPSKTQRDKLYSRRINPVIFSPGAGIVLFGDKTGLAKASAFDRINVRRLFIFLEDAISAAAKDQLFEFNDEITRTNFVNIVEPFLRDVQAKRGIQDYVVICDETNNTAAVIDSNEFVADIYIKPARSINFIGLTFVATRTGVAFEEVIGNV